MVSRVSASKSRAPEASRATLVFAGSRVEVGACDDGFCDPLSINTAEA